MRFLYFSRMKDKLNYTLSRCDEIVKPTLTYNQSMLLLMVITRTLMKLSTELDRGNYASLTDTSSVYTDIMKN